MFHAFHSAGGNADRGPALAIRTALPSVYDEAKRSRKGCGFIRKFTINVALCSAKVAAMDAAFAEQKATYTALGGKMDINPDDDVTGDSCESKIKVNDADGVAPVLPDYGVFLRSPANGSDWIHPDDHGIVDGIVPSNRVFCRFRFEDGYYHFRYGSIVFRLRPCLWLPLRGEGFDLGDRVETTGIGLTQELFVSEITGMVFDDSAGEIRYHLARTPISGKLYSAEHLRLLSDKTKLRQGDTVHPLPHWNDAFRKAYPASEYLHPTADDEADQRADE